MQWLKFEANFSEDQRLRLLPRFWEFLSVLKLSLGNARKAAVKLKRRNVVIRFPSR